MNGTTVRCGYLLAAIFLAARPAAAVVSHERGEREVTDGARLLASAIYRLDALQSDSLTLEEGVDWKGRPVTNVLRWADASTNGFYGQSMVLGELANGLKPRGVEPWPMNPYPLMLHAHPNRILEEMRPGVWRPALDFGIRCNTAVPHSASNSAAISFVKPVANLRDSFTVYRDREDGRGEILGNASSGLATAHYMRSSTDRILYTTYAAVQVTNGYIAVDGERKVATDRLSYGWHLVSFGPTAATRTDSLMQERNCNSGGGCVAEQIGFGRPLSSVERAFMEAYLQHKWFGLGAAPELTNTVDRLRVDSGETFESGESLYLESLAGGGAVTAPGLVLVDGATLSVGFDSEGVVRTLAVTGSLDFAGSATLAIAAPAPDAIRIGEHALVTATGGINGLNPARLEVAGDLPETWAFSVTNRGSRLSLIVSTKPGYVHSSVGGTLTFDDGGKVLSLREAESGRELLDSPTVWCFARDADGNEVDPLRMESLADGRFAIRFASGTVVERIEATEWGWRFTVESSTLPEGCRLVPASCRSAMTAYIGTLANAASDEASGLILRSFDYDLQMSASVWRMQLEMSKGRSPVGRRFGLVAGPRAEILARARQMIRSSGVAFSELGGPWALASEDARKSYLLSDSTLAQVDANIDAARRAGLGIVHIDSWYRTLGHYQVSTVRFPNGIADFIAAADRIRAAGMVPSIHCLTGCISFGDPWIVPEAHSNLLAVCTYTLAEPITDASTEVVVNEMPQEGHDLVTTYSSNGSVLQIDGELIVYSGIRRTPPYAFTGITRGKRIATTLRNHAAGAKVKYLRQHYNAFYPEPDSRLAEELADNIANVYNAIGAKMVYYDGSEGFNDSYAVAKMAALITERLDTSRGAPHIEMSSVPPHYWPLRTTYGAWDMFRYGYKAGENAHLESNLRQGTKANFLPIHMGWWGPLVAKETYRSCFPDESEYFAAKNAGNDATMSLEGIDVSTLLPPVLQEKALTVIGWYERMRLARAFAPSVLADLETLGRESRLRQDETGRWMHTPIVTSRHRIVGADVGNAWTVSSAAAAEADLRIEAFYGLADFDSAPATNLFDAATLAAAAAAPLTNASCRVALAVSSLTDDSHGTVTRLTATNPNATATGAWVGLERIFPFPDYLNVGKSAGVGFWVKGDGSGALLDIQLQHPTEYGLTRADHFIRLDFTGWRYVELLYRERDVDELRNHSWPHSVSTANYMTVLSTSTIEAVRLILNEVPANGTTDIQISTVKALGRVAPTLTAVTLTLGETPLTVPFDLKAGDWAELAEGVWNLYDEKGDFKRRAAGPIVTLPEGETSLAFAAANDAGAAARAEVRLFSRGTSVPALADLTEAQRTSLAWEAEMPVEWAPSLGADSLPPVKVRPGESARLEVTLRGPIDNPVLTFETPFGTETWPLDSVASGAAATFTNGPLVAGVTAVSLASSSPQTAKALVEIVKRYRTADDCVRTWRGGASGAWTNVANWAMADGSPAVTPPRLIDDAAEFSVPPGEVVTVTVPRTLDGALPLAKLKVTGGGKVELTVADAAVPPPIYRFDASAAASLETVLSTEEDGGLRTNVVCWLDADGNGFSARPPATFAVPGVKNGDLVATNPAVVVVQTRPGVWRPAVDFGAHSAYYTNLQVKSSAGLHIFDPGGVKVPGATSRIWEAMIAWSPTASGGRSFTLTDSSAYHYHHGGSNLLSGGNANSGVLNGYHAIDGVEVASNASLSADYHLVSFAPTNATAVNRLAWDRDCNAGGATICEMACYTNRLPLVRRKRLESELMHKWFDAPAPVWTNALASLDVGGELRLATSSVYAVAALSGAGRLSGATLAGVGELAPTGEIVLDGTLAFAASVTLDLCAYPDLAVPGDHPVVTAAVVENLDLATWNVRSTLDELTHLTLVERDGTIYARTRSLGTLLFIR